MILKNIIARSASNCENTLFVQEFYWEYRLLNHRFALEMSCKQSNNLLVQEARTSGLAIRPRRAHKLA